MGRFFLSSLLALALAVLAFRHLAEEVLEGELAPYDQAILARVQSVRGPGLEGLAAGLSLVGGAGAFLVTGLACWLLARRKRLDGVVLLILMAGATLLVILLKSLFRVTRPSTVSSVLPGSVFSFPSGHSLAAICLYGYLAWLAAERRAWAPAVLFALMVPAIDWSRLYLGVHWPSDVLAGSLVGGAWLLLCLLGRRRETA